MVWKKIISTTVLLFTCGILISQVYTGDESNNILEGSQKVRVDGESGNVEYFEFSTSSLKAGFTVNGEIIKHKLGLPKHYSLKQSSDEIIYGERHSEYQLYLNNILVEGMGYAVHYKNGIPKNANGKIIRADEEESVPKLTEKEAVEKAVSSINSKEFLWDKNIELYPKALLIYVPQDTIVKLCYKVDVYSLKPLIREYIYVDAINGEVLKRVSRIHYADQQATAVTFYNGTVQITTNDDSGLYTLNESSRGNGIHTYDLNNGQIYENASEFTDDDNYWDTEKDKVAYDVHYGTEKTYDYYLNKFGRNSIDGNGLALKSYVHFGVRYANAFWDGERMTYGDGNGTTQNALTSLDIVAHEITHGLTEYTANLEYLNESGALNESFSDIFGVAVDFYTNSTSANYFLGEQIFNDGSSIRNMADPNSGQTPDTYMGNYWVTGTHDFGGVHTNSSVQNYWFYLLCEGGSGRNDNGDDYIVEPIGLEAAEAITYRNLTVYLTRYCDYEDARFYSIQSAIDLYGSCSNEVIQVTNAWHAVGVGEAFKNVVTAAFVADQTFFCKTPANVSIDYIGLNADLFKWYLDGELISNSEEPIIEINNAGEHDIKLIVEGSTGCITSDTAIINNYIVVAEDGEPESPKYTPITTYGGEGGVFSVLFNQINCTSDGANDGYMDYSCQHRTNITEGKAYPITIETGNTNEEVVGVWLDINNDGDFSSEEKLFSSQNVNLHTGIVNIPKGLHYDIPLRLRVGADRYDYVSNLNARSNAYYGQYEDYSVIIKRNTDTPIAEFEVADTVIGVGGTVAFCDKSLNLPTNRNWQFQGAEPDNSNESNPIVTFNSEGEFEVTLTVSNDYGSSVASKTIKVVSDFVMGQQSKALSSTGFVFDSGGKDGTYNINEKSEFLITPDCAKEVVLTIEAFSTEECCDKLVVYNGDSESSPIITTLKGNPTLPIELSASSGQMLLVFESDGSVSESGFEGKWTTIGYGEGQNVVADFSVLEEYLPVNFDIQFNDNSSYEPLKWYWEFGDGYVSKEQNPVHKYILPGNYNAKLAVDNCFSKDTVLKEIIIDEKPNLVISDDTIRINIVSGEKIDSFIPLGNLNGGLLAYEAFLFDIYPKKRTLQAASVTNAELAEALGKFKVGLGKNVFYYQDLKRVLMSYGVECVYVNEANLTSAIDTLDALILDDSGTFIKNYSDQIREWVKGGGFLILQGDGIIDSYNLILDKTGISFYSVKKNSKDGVLIDHSITQHIDKYEIAKNADCRLNIKRPAINLINDIDGDCYAGIVHLGLGNIMAVGNEAFQYMNSLGHQDLLLRSIELTIPKIKARALKISEGYQFVEDNSNDSIIYEIDSKGLLDGEYIGDIKVNSNDSDNQLVDIPFLLSVTGIENISVSENTVDFLDVFVNQVDSTSLIIRNTGTKQLELTQVEISSDDLGMDFVPQVLMPGQSLTVSIKFTPKLSKTYTESIRIHSSDPDTPVYTVSILGNVLNPPVVQSTSEVVENIDSYVTSVRDLIISNQTGGSALSIDSIFIKDVNVNQTIDSDTLAYDLSGIAVETINKYMYYFNQLMIGYGAQSNSAVLDTTSMKDVIVLDYNINDNLNENQIDFIDNWIKAGGALFININDIQENTLGKKLLEKIGVKSSYTDRNETDLEVGEHLIMNRIDINNLLTSGGMDFEYDYGTPLIKDIYGRVYALALEYGYGRVVITTFDVLNQSKNNHKKLFAVNCMRWLANKNSWLWVSDYPTEEILVGSSDTLKLTFDAANRIAGSYYANIEISTNDPITPKSVVPITMNINGIPSVSFDIDTLRFNEQYINQTTVDSFMIYNSGTDMLEVSGVTCTGDNYMFDNSLFSLQPRKSKWIQVTFNPLQAFNGYDYIIFESNSISTKDTLPILGSSIEPPVMSISASELSLKLRSNEIDTVNFEIVNSGGSMLNYSANITYNPLINLTEDENGWIYTESEIGTLPMESSDVLKFAVNASELQEGNYSAQIIFNSNDPINSEFVANVKLEIDNNMAPVVLNAIEDADISISDDFYPIDLSQYFEDPDGEALSFSSSVSNSEIVSCTFENNYLVITPLSEGNTNIKVEAIDSKGLFVDSEFKVNVKGIATTLFSGSNINSLQVYPNPVKSILYIYTGLEENIENVQLFDSEGRMIRFKYNFNQNIIQINLSDLEQGMYVLKILSDKKETIKKVVKK